MKNKQLHTVDELVDKLRDPNPKMEDKLLYKHYIRELYKQLGDPNEKDFPDEFKHAYRFDKERGYTTEIDINRAEYMKAHNRTPTLWRIKSASITKVKIVEEYTREGWTCDVGGFNVACMKYVKHPRYKNIWVKFYVSRDCARYEYVLEKHD